MPFRYWEREKVYRRRLYASLPFAVLAVLALFGFGDRVLVQRLEQNVGWQGELQIMPEITIVPDDQDHISREYQRQLNTMTTVDLDLAEGHDIASPEFQNTDRDKQFDKLDWDEWDEYEIRTVKSSREVPYSEDYVILKMVEPKYPPRELNAGIEGSVTIELLINERGRVEKAVVLSGVGPKSFEESSLEAAKQFVFQPPITDGVPAPMWIKFHIKFRIFG